jgi:hypothetical protein
MPVRGRAVTVREPGGLPYASNHSQSAPAGYRQGTGRSTNVLGRYPPRSGRDLVVRIELDAKLTKYIVRRGCVLLDKRRVLFGGGPHANMRRHDLC